MRPPLRLKVIVWAGRATRDPLIVMWLSALLLATLVVLTAVRR